jgi:hypothetical protein
MNTVARSYVAGLSLAALARLGGAVATSPPREVGKRRIVDASLTRDRGLDRGRRKRVGGVGEAPLNLGRWAPAPAVAASGADVPTIALGS